MRFAFAPLLALGSFLGVAVAQTALFINTPTLPRQPDTLSRTGLVLIQHDASRLTDFCSVIRTADESQVIVFGVPTPLTNNSISWLVTEPAGTSLEFLIRDSTGTGQNTAPFTVSGGGPASCGPSSSTGSSSATSSAPSGSSKTGSTTASTTVTTSTTATTSVPVTTPATTPSATSPKPSSTSPGSTSGSASGSAPSASHTSGAASRAGPAVGVAVAAALGAAFLA
ncbi:hypothetical protein B0H11DRAFT_2219322 [Mycena galericulata]|nr:hypothetical protein B0H11DRAFT_2219322 [Mycena galericulata]